MGFGLFLATCPTGTHPTLVCVHSGNFRGAHITSLSECVRMKDQTALQVTLVKAEAMQLSSITDFLMKSLPVSFGVQHLPLRPSASSRDPSPRHPSLAWLGSCPRNRSTQSRGAHTISCFSSENHVHSVHGGRDRHQATSAYFCQPTVKTWIPKAGRLQHSCSSDGDGWLPGADS